MSQTKVQLIKDAATSEDSIVHDGDTNTKIRFPAADTISADTGGSERLRVISDGKIGIGRTDPVNFVDISRGSDEANILVVRGADNTTEYGAIGVDSGNMVITGGGAGGINTGMVFRTAASGTETERMHINSDGRVLAGNYFTSKQIGGRTSSLQIQGTDANTSSLSLFRYSANDGGSAITLGKGRASSAGGTDKLNNGDTVGSILWVGANNADLQNGNMAAIDVQADATQGGGDTPSRMRFFTVPDSSSTLAERVRIDKDGFVGIGTTDPSNADSADGGLQIRPGGSNGGPAIAFKRPDTGNETTAIAFVNQTTGVGFIKYTNSGTSYLTSSDYRLKENVVAISDGITRLKTLKPSRFNFKVDKGKTVDGFLAHEVTAVPEAVSGTKDEVDENDKPIYQGIDQAKLVPLLTAALQEATAKIELLETKVAALEAA